MNNLEFFDDSYDYNDENEYAPEMHNFFHEYATQILKKAKMPKVVHYMSFDEIAKQLDTLSRNGDDIATSLLEDIYVDGLFKRQTS